LTGTIFHGTKVSIAIWLFVMVDMCSDKNGISAREVNRKYGVTVETAWHMLHRLREAMTRDPLAGVLRGTIVADETYVGGDPKNKHASKKENLVPVRLKAGEPRPSQYTAKTPVLALVNVETGEVRGHVVTETTVTGGTISKFLGNHVDIAESVLHTDESGLYPTLGKAVCRPPDSQPSEEGVRAWQRHDESDRGLLRTVEAVYRRHAPQR
jgi:hypothetical protein